jgi:hypothetical protein
MTIDIGVKDTLKSYYVRIPNRVVMVLKGVLYTKFSNRIHIPQDKEVMVPESPRFFLVRKQLLDLVELFKNDPTAINPTKRAMLIVYNYDLMEIIAPGQVAVYSSNHIPQMVYELTPTSELCLEKGYEGSLTHQERIDEILSYPNPMKVLQAAVLLNRRNSTHFANLQLAIPKDHLYFFARKILESHEDTFELIDHLHYLAIDDKYFKEYTGFTYWQYNLPMLFEIVNDYCDIDLYSYEGEDGELYLYNPTSDYLRITIESLGGPTGTYKVERIVPPNLPQIHFERCLASDIQNIAQLRRVE